MPAICAVIFDMDGLLIDTEPIWREAEMVIFGSVGVHLSEEQGLQTMGVRIAQVVEHWYQRQPWHGPSVQDVTRRIEQFVIDRVLSVGQPKAGVCDSLAMVRAAGLPIAIASSSSGRLIDAVIERLNIRDYIDAICSGDNEAEGKPHPAVYLTTARRLRVPPNACLALEDSPNGVVAAKTAGMYCIVVPDPYLADDPRMRQADLRLASLEDFSTRVLMSMSACMPC